MTGSQESRQPHHPFPARRGNLRHGAIFHDCHLRDDGTAWKVDILNRTTLVVNDMLHPKLNGM